MRPLRLLALAATVVFMLAGCGGNTSGETGSAQRATTDAAAQSQAGVPNTYIKSDGDNDSDDAADFSSRAAEDEGSLLAPYSDVASAADRQAIASTIRGYFAAAERNNGLAACSLLHARLAAQLAQSQSRVNGSVHEACATAMAQILPQLSQRLAGEGAASVTIVSVHLKGGLGIAIVGFKTASERQITVEREHNRWKIDAVVDTDLP